jgi:predicted dinucleotide-binding enzyme
MARGRSRPVIFLYGDDKRARCNGRYLVEQRGYAPVSFGRIAKGGQLVQG